MGKHCINWNLTVVTGWCKLSANFISWLVQTCYTLKLKTTWSFFSLNFQSKSISKHKQHCWASSTTRCVHVISAWFDWIADCVKQIRSGANQNRPCVNFIPLYAKLQTPKSWLFQCILQNIPAYFSIFMYCLRAPHSWWSEKVYTSLPSLHGLAPQCTIIIINTGVASK